MTGAPRLPSSHRQWVGLVFTFIDYMLRKHVGRGAFKLFAHRGAIIGAAKIPDRHDLDCRRYRYWRLAGVETRSARSRERGLSAVEPSWI